jgi:hypothetical protein
MANETQHHAPGREKGINFVCESKASSLTFFSSHYFSVPSSIKKRDHHFSSIIIIILLLLSSLMIRYTHTHAHGLRLSTLL